MVLFICSDAVVAGADYHHVEQKMLPENLRNYTSKYWEREKWHHLACCFTWE